MATATEPFGYFRNDWNVIGLRDYEEGTRITPENRLLISDNREVEIRFGRNLVPLGRKNVKTLLEGWMPVVLVTAQDGAVRYDLRLWASPLPTLNDWRAAFDWPTEGENFLNFVQVRATNTGNVSQKGAVEVVLDLPEPEAIRSVTWNLAPQTSEQITVYFPFSPWEDQTALGDIDAELWQQRTIEYWRNLMGGAAHIEVPCRKSAEALLAAHVCQFIANDHGELQGGEGFYDHFYIRDGGYQIMQLEEAGLWDAVDKAMKSYLGSQRPDGRFETQKMQFDANGQALWALWQYYKITDDRDWLEKVYPQMRRSADWMIQARRETAGSPFAGLLPQAVADGEYLWDGKHHIVGYDLWNFRGLICITDAARALGRDAEADELRAEVDDYRKTINKAVETRQTAHFPPSWELQGTHWGNTETLWPTALFDADDPRVTATIDHARNVHGGGFIEGTIQWLGRPDAIHPYMSAYTTMASLRQGDHEQVVEDFYWYLLHSTAGHAFPEGIYYKRRFAWSNTIPHVTGASNFALLLRHMLIDERGDELHLLSAVPDWWLGDGQVIEVEAAPTHFGEMNLTVRGSREGVEIQFDPPRRKAPKRVVLHLPKSRPAKNAPAGVELVERNDQAKRWDFPTVIEKYRQIVPPAAKVIPGVVEFPLDEPVKTDRCTALDVTALANTDPITAPFGVPNPGKFLFTGLPTGTVKVRGIPFEIIDPARNEGHGLIVLHSPRAPANRQWPTEVTIPVGQTARRAFFLGNVHGWHSQDPGSGPWGAVAEYVIRYADGSEQSVPLITGRTIEEWSGSPQSDNVVAGLRGTPWHLNILCVELRKGPVQEIVFRDLGTRAAPVLAAVTIEK